MRTARSTSLPALLLLALAPYGCGGQSGNGTAEARASGDASPAADPPQETRVADLAALGFNEGDDENAVVRVVEFSDFGCIHCARFHLDSYPALHDEFIAGGDIVWKYVPVTIGGFPNGDLAALAGECAGALGSFAAYRDLLFERREEWMDPERGAALFERYAEGLGLDGTAFEACLTGEEAAERVAISNGLAARLGVRGTPTFLIQEHWVQGAPELEAFQQALRQLVSDIRDGGRD